MWKKFSKCCQMWSAHWDSWSLRGALVSYAEKQGTWRLLQTINLGISSYHSKRDNLTWRSCPKDHKTYYLYDSGKYLANNLLTVKRFLYNQGLSASMTFRKGKDATPAFRAKPEQIQIGSKLYDGRPVSLRLLVPLPQIVFWTMTKVSPVASNRISQADRSFGKGKGDLHTLVGQGSSVLPSMNPHGLNWFKIPHSWRI